MGPVRSHIGRCRTQWTHRFLPNIGRWLSKPSFDLTQALSGHGCFRSYLLRRNRAEDSYWGYCMDPEDTTEHTVFDCPRWLDDRARLTDILRRLPNAGDVEDILCWPICPRNPPQENGFSYRPKESLRTDNDDWIDNGYQRRRWTWRTGLL